MRWAARTLFLLCFVLGGLVLAGGGSPAHAIGRPHINPPPSPPKPPAPPSVDDLLSRFFGDAKSKVDGFKSEAERLRDEARQLGADVRSKATEASGNAEKMYEYYGDCPSPKAQATYDDLKARKKRLQEIRDAQESAAQTARANRATCKSTTHADAQCDAAYDDLPFTAVVAACDDGIAFLSAAMDALAALRCVSGCTQTARIVVPTVTVETSGSLQGSGTSAPSAPSVPKLPAKVGDAVASARAADFCQVCSEWDAGSFHVNVDPGDGEIDASVRAKLPHCVKWEKLALHVPTYTFDMGRVLAWVRSTGQLPSSVSDSRVHVVIPTRRVRYVTGVHQAPCTRPVSICTKPGRSTITLDPGADPTSIVTSQTSSCTNNVVVGCSEPPYGIAADFQAVDIPDPANARVAIDLAPGSGGIHFPDLPIDLNRPEFGLKSTTTTITCPPTLPTLKIGSRKFDTGFCVQPVFSKLVGTP